MDGDKGCMSFLDSKGNEVEGNQKYSNMIHTGETLEKGNVDIRDTIKILDKR